MTIVNLLCFNCCDYVIIVWFGFYFMLPCFYLCSIRRRLSYNKYIIIKYSIEVYDKL